jgi:acyl carrier protein
VRILQISLTRSKGLIMATSLRGLENQSRRRTMIGNRRRPAVPVRPRVEDLECRTNLSALVLGASAGSPPRVEVVDQPGAVVHSFLAYGHGYLAGVNVARRDVTGHGVDNIMTARARGTSDIHVHSPIPITTPDIATIHGRGDAIRAPLGALTVSVKERVIDLVSEEFGVARQRVTTQSSFEHLIAESGADSLDLVQLLLRIEEEFNITIPNEEVDRIKTVGQAIQHVEKHIKSHEIATPHPRDQVGGGHGPR